MSKRAPFLKILRNHPVKLIIICLLSLIVLAFYALRGNKDLMRNVLNSFTYPVRIKLSEIFSVFDFSVAELFYTVFLGILIIGVISIILLSIYHKVIRDKVVSFFMSVIIVILLVLSSFNWLHDTTYFGDNFSEKSGLELRDITYEEVYAVAEHFAEKALELSSQVPRDEEGNLIIDKDAVFNESLNIYPKLIANKGWDFLERSSVLPKAVFFPSIVSATGSAGFYFPLTGETNMNMESPKVFIPAIIAHEMAHQRFIAEESGANFVGIMASIESDDPLYEYSGYMLGLLYLANTLYSIKNTEEALPEGYPDYYEMIKSLYNEDMQRDFDENNQFYHENKGWFRTLFKKAYNLFLKNNGQVDLGITYNACIYYLTVWFTDYETL